MFYHLYEMNHAAMAPLRAGADMMRRACSNPLNPLSSTAFGRSLDAGFEVFERLTRRYIKPEFGLATTTVDDRTVAVTEEIIWSRPFCNLVHFKRTRCGPQTRSEGAAGGAYVRPLRHIAAGNGRGAAAIGGYLYHRLIDARMVPVTEGTFDLDDYISYVIDMLREIGPGAHVVAVCQPSVPVLAAVSLMEADGDGFAPASMTLMGGPIDTRINPTAVNGLATAKPIEWFRDNVVMQVPWPQPAFGRNVYPGFLQLSGFMSMNLDKHMTAHKDFYLNLVKNDGDPAEKHRDFTMNIWP